MGFMGAAKGPSALATKQARLAEKATLKAKVRDELAKKKHKQQTQTQAAVSAAAAAATASSSPSSSGIDATLRGSAMVAHAPPMMSATNAFGNTAPTLVAPASYPPTSIAASASTPPSLALPVALEHKEDCLCTICICGRHSCPPTPHFAGRAAGDPSMYQSEIRDAFRGTFAPVSRVAPPRQTLWQGPAFAATSTHKADYVRHPLLPNPQARSSSVMHDTGVGRSSAPFDARTTHGTSFTSPRATAVPPRFNMERFANLRTRGPETRDFLTESRQNYAGRTAPLTQPAKPPGASGVLNAPAGAAFDGVSTAQSDYREHRGVKPPLPAVRNELRHTLPEDREFLSEHQAEYVPKRKENCPAAPLQVPFKLRSGHIYVEKVTDNTYRHKGEALDRTGAPTHRLGLAQM